MVIAHGRVIVDDADAGSRGEQLRLTELARKLEVMLARVQEEENTIVSREMRVKSVESAVASMGHDFSELQNALASLARTVDEMNISARLNDQELRIEETRHELREKLLAISGVLDLVKANSKKLVEFEEKSLNVRAALGQLEEMSAGISTLVASLNAQDDAFRDLRNDVDALRKLAGTLPEAAEEAAEEAAVEAAAEEAVEKGNTATAVAGSTQTNVALLPTSPPLEEVEHISTNTPLWSSQQEGFFTRAPDWLQLKNELNSMIQTAYEHIENKQYDNAKEIYTLILQMSENFGNVCKDQAELNTINASLEALYNAFTAATAGKKK